MNKIVVTNIYGKHNLGDNAIRNSALRLLNDTFPKETMYLLVESYPDFPIQVSFDSNVKQDISVYGYGISSEGKPKSIFIKLFRLIWIIAGTIALLALSYCSSVFLPKRGVFSYVRNIKNANLIVGMGGGYFMSTNPYTDFFGTILNVLPLLVARFYRKTIVILPISFGPFAHPLHEKITGYAVATAQVICRDKITLKKVEKYATNSLFLPDMALYDWDEQKNVTRQPYYTLSCREYLKGNQSIAEKELAKFIDLLWTKHKLKCVFIPTAANPIEENDILVAERIQSYVAHKNSFSINVPKSPAKMKDVLEQSQFSICNRMHHAILSATVYTPFISIAYQHKTIGFLEYLELTEWNQDMDKLDAGKLVAKVESLLDKKTYKSFIDHLKHKRPEVLKNRQSIIDILLKKIRNSE